MVLTDPEYILKIFLIFVRIGAVLMSAPFFSYAAFPVRVRIFFSVLLAYALSGLIPGDLPPYATTTVGMALSIGIEAFTGILLGLGAQLVFWMIQFAAQIIGFQIGLTLAQAFDPSSGTTTNPVGRILGMVALLTFVLIDGHHQVLRALMLSFQAVPLGAAHLAAGGPMLLSWTGAFFTGALRLAAPFMVTILLIDAALGVFSRLSPQTDLFSISLPVKLFVGLGVTLLYIQYFIPVMPGLLDEMYGHLADMIIAISPR